MGVDERYKGMVRKRGGDLLEKFKEGLWYIRNREGPMIFNCSEGFNEIIIVSP